MNLLFWMVEKKLLDEVRVGARGRCRPADEIEHLAILDAVVGDTLHAPVPVKIDRHHALVGDGGRQE